MAGHFSQHLLVQTVCAVVDVLLLGLKLLARILQRSFRSSCSNLVDVIQPMQRGSATRASVDRWKLQKERCLLLVLGATEARPKDAKSKIKH